MAYSDFTLDSITQKFELQQKIAGLFVETELILVSDWLKQSLEHGKRLALFSGNEKARSEFIIAPIMVEIEQTFGDRIAIFSGKNLEAAREQGLTGECDFILTQGAKSLTIQNPILALVEAKKADIELGLGQCVAQMVGAKLMNARQDVNHPIYGCVTTGEDWQFLKLEEQILYIDSDRYYINEVDKILGCLQSIIKLSIVN